MGTDISFFREPIDVINGKHITVAKLCIIAGIRFHRCEGSAAGGHTYMSRDECLASCDGGCEHEEGALEHHFGLSWLDLPRIFYCEKRCKDICCFGGVNYCWSSR